MYLSARGRNIKCSVRWAATSSRYLPVACGKRHRWERAGENPYGLTRVGTLGEGRNTSQVGARPTPQLVGRCHSPPHLFSIADPHTLHFLQVPVPTGLQFSFLQLTIRKNERLSFPPTAVHMGKPSRVRVPFAMLRFSDRT